MAHAARRWTRTAALFGALLALLVLFAADAGAEGAGSALSIEFTVQPRVMVAPGEITMTFVIENRSSRTVQNIYIASADGLLSEPIGQLGPGESQTLVRPHTVTQAELDEGLVAYVVSHDPQSPGEEKEAYQVSAVIIKGEPQPNVSFTRQLSSERVPKGGVVTVTYKIANIGNVALSALRIRDGLGDFTGRLEQLNVGDTKTFISRATLNEAAESAPVLEYVVPSGETVMRRLDPTPIGIANSALEMSFTVGHSVFEKDTVDAILILSNGGNVNYTDITVLDDVYGGVIADAVSIPCGESPVEIAYTYPLRGQGEYRWRVTGTNDAGESLDLRTDTLTVPASTGEQTVDISLSASARTPRISRAGRVTFDISVSNAGTLTAVDAQLYEVNRGQIRKLAVIPIGKPTVCSVSYDVDSSGQFIFCVNYTDAEGLQRAVTSAPIDVVIASDGVRPERWDGAGSVLQGKSVKVGNNRATFIVLLIIAGTALTVMITILIVVSVRARRERLRQIAADKQRIKEELGRTGSFQTVKSSGKRRRRKKTGSGQRSGS